MSKREWKSGDVAMRTTAPHLDKYEQLTVATTCLKSAHGPGLHWHHVGGGWDPLDAVGPTYRPLAVIDPEDREAVERLVGHDAFLGNLAGEQDVTAMQAALREFANPQEPRPEEPTGLGAVVEDAEGVEWVRWRRGSERRPWRRAEHQPTYEDYADIAVVRVLSPGVEVES